MDILKQACDFPMLLTSTQSPLLYSIIILFMGLKIAHHASYAVGRWVAPLNMPFLHCPISRLGLSSSAKYSGHLGPEYAIWQRCFENKTDCIKLSVYRFHLDILAASLEFINKPYIPILLFLIMQYKIKKGRKAFNKRCECCAGLQKQTSHLLNMKDI